MNFGQAVPITERIKRSMKHTTQKSVFFCVQDPDLGDVILFLLHNERNNILEKEDWEKLAAVDMG